MQAQPPKGARNHEEYNYISQSIDTSTYLSIYVHILSMLHVSLSIHPSIIECLFSALSRALARSTDQSSVRSRDDISVSLFVCLFRRHLFTLSFLRLCFFSLASGCFPWFPRASASAHPRAGSRWCIDGKALSLAKSRLLHHDHHNHNFGLSLCDPLSSLECTRARDRQA